MHQDCLLVMRCVGIDYSRGSRCFIKVMVVLHSFVRECEWWSGGEGVNTPFSFSLSENGVVHRVVLEIKICIYINVHKL